MLEKLLFLKTHWRNCGRDEVTKKKKKIVFRIFKIKENEVMKNLFEMRKKNHRYFMKININGLIKRKYKR